MNRIVLTVLTALAVLAASNAFGKDESGYYQPIRNNFGLAFGTPAGLNLFVCKYSRIGLGWRVSGLYIPGSKNRHIGGLQLNLLWKLLERRDVVVDASLVAGYFSRKTDPKTETWRYRGIASAVRWKQLFAEAVITAGTGSFESPVIGFQLGVVLRTERRRN